MPQVLQAVLRSANLLRRPGSGLCSGLQQLLGSGLQQLLGSGLQQLRFVVWLPTEVLPPLLLG
jgi:hypothetical protein